MMSMPTMSERYLPKKVTVYYLNKEKYKPTTHRHITTLYHDEHIWYLFSENHITAQIKFDEVLRVDYILEDVDTYPKEDKPS
jgi:hypothetical protein